MKQTRVKFDAGRTQMIMAFTQLSALAHQAGVGAEAITALHGEFFDGNQSSKEALDEALLLAIRHQDRK